MLLLTYVLTAETEILHLSVALTRDEATDPRWEAIDLSIFFFICCIFSACADLLFIIQYSIPVQAMPVEAAANKFSILNTSAQHVNLIGYL